MRCDSASSSVRWAAAQPLPSWRAKSEGMRCERGVCQFRGVFPWEEEEEEEEEDVEKFPDAISRETTAAVNALVVLPA